MKCWSFLVVAFAAVASAQSVLDVFAALPDCGKSCVLPELVSANCNVTTLSQVGECLCTNDNAFRNISQCLQTTCDLTEMYTVSLANQGICAGYPVHDRSQEIVICVAIMSAITIPLGLLRFFTRYKISNRLGPDDWLILVCLAPACAAVPIIVILAEKGFGKHVWNINLLNVPIILKLFYIMELLYIAVQVLAKMSIVFFYLRVFTQRWFRYTSYAVLAWLVLHGTIFLFLTAFQCLPLKSLWDPTKPTSCISKAGLIYAGAAGSILEDVVILAMPIPCISSLHLGLSKKLGVGFMFAVGSFSLVTSCIRLRFLHGFGSMSDPTWDNLNTMLWSIIEVYSSVFCACVPALRQFVVRVFPKTATVNDSYITSNRNSNFSPRGMSVSHARTVSEDDDYDDSTKVWPLPDEPGLVSMETDNRTDGDRESTMSSNVTSTLTSEIELLKYDRYEV